MGLSFILSLTHTRTHTHTLARAQNNFRGTWNSKLFEQSKDRHCHRILLHLVCKAIYKAKTSSTPTTDTQTRAQVHTQTNEAESATLDSQLIVCNLETMGIVASC